MYDYADGATGYNGFVGCRWTYQTGVAGWGCGLAFESWVFWRLRRRWLQTWVREAQMLYIFVGDHYSIAQLLPGEPKLTNMGIEIAVSTVDG